MKFASITKFILLVINIFLISSYTHAVTLYQCNTPKGLQQFQDAPCSDKHQQQTITIDLAPSSPLKQCLNQTKINYADCLAKLPQGIWNQDGGVALCQKEQQLLNEICQKPQKKVKNERKIKKIWSKFNKKQKKTIKNNKFLLNSAKNGRVTKIYDGDTFEFKNNNHNYRIRIAEIDCPEKTQTGGIEARQALKKLIKPYSVRIKPMTIDQYGRIVAKVSRNGKIIANELVRSGYCWHYSKYSDSLLLKRLQLEAQSHQRGLWQQSSPMPPWKYRQNH